MAGKPMSHRSRIAVLGAAALLCGCADDPPYEGAFDVPVALAALPADLSPFDETIGVVANAHGGSIAPLALKQGRFLTEDPSASFLRGNWIPTGGARVLSSVAIYAPEPYALTLFAGDRHQGQLVEVPWIVGRETVALPDGGSVDAPVEVDPTFTEPCFLPATDATAFDPFAEAPCPTADGAGPRLALFSVKKGYTATEVWTLTWSADRQTWRVSGSRSGRQEFEATPGIPYLADKRRVAFTIEGNPADWTEGDRVVFATDTGIVEHDVGGVPEQLLMSEDHTQMAVIVFDSVLEAPVLRWFDPAEGAVVGTVPLPSGAAPVRASWSEDGQTLFVADGSRPAFYAVPVGQTDFTEHPVPWPIQDIAVLDDAIQRAFVVPLDGTSVWMVDVGTDTVVDLNASVAGDQGMEFGTPVMGLEAIPRSYRWPQTAEVGRENPLEGRSIAVALFSGEVVFMEEETGCLVQDLFGPRTAVQTSFGSTTSGDVTPNFDVTFGPYLEPNARNDRSIQVNSCAGIARNEAWNLRYDETSGGWRVRSDQSGDQASLAIEDQRFVSDRGEISLTIRAGAVPSQDGWTFDFSTVRGALSANGDFDGDGIRETTLGVPGDPLFVDFLAGPRWVPSLDEATGVSTMKDGRTWRSYVLVPAQASDNVARVDPRDGSIERRWD